MTMPAPDPALFSFDERQNEYAVHIYVRGEVSKTIIADSLEDAKAKAESMARNEDFLADLGLDDVDDARVCSVSRAPRMYRVIRDGKPIQTRWLEDGDLPREPDERGF